MTGRATLAWLASQTTTRRRPSVDTGSTHTPGASRPRRGLQAALRGGVAAITVMAGACLADAKGDDSVTAVAVAIAAHQASLDACVYGNGVGKVLADIDALVAKQHGTDLPELKSRAAGSEPALPVAPSKSTTSWMSDQPT